MGKVLIPVTEVVNTQGIATPPTSKLYGNAYIEKFRDVKGRTVIFMQGKERIISDSYADLKFLTESGYLDFLVPLTVLSVDGGVRDDYPYNISLLASNVVEIYEDPNDASNSIVNYRDEDDPNNIFYTVDEDLAAITALIPSAGSPAASFTEYRAMLTQSGTNAPVADDIDGGATDVPFIDTIGGVWSYFNDGRYRYTKAGAFADVTKVEYILGINNYNQGADIAAAIYKIDANTIELQVARLDAFLSPSLANLENGVLYNQPIVIRVYN
jgi:hypothetical protein